MAMTKKKLSDEARNSLASTHEASTMGSLSTDGSSLSGFHFKPPDRLSSQVQVNAIRKLRTIEQLKKHDEALNRKTQQVAMKREFCQAVNNARKERVAAHNQHVAELQAGRQRTLRKAESAREALVCEQRVMQKDCSDLVGAKLTHKLSRSASVRERALEDRTAMVCSKIQEGQKKLLRKTQTLNAVKESLGHVNAKREERVAAHSLEEERQRLALHCQQLQRQIARSERLCQQRLHEREEMACMGSKRDESIRNAVKHRERSQLEHAAMIQRKQQIDEEKLLRKQERLACESRRLAYEHVIKDERRQMVKHYDELVEKHRRSYAGSASSDDGGWKV